jgi:hypothetical protein
MDGQQCVLMAQRAVPSLVNYLDAAKCSQELVIGKIGVCSKGFRDVVDSEQLNGDQ